MTSLPRAIVTIVSACAITLNSTNEALVDRPWRGATSTRPLRVGNDMAPAMPSSRALSQVASIHLDRMCVKSILQLLL